MKHKNNIEIVPQIFLAVVGVILVGLIIYYILNSVRATKKLADKIILDIEKTAVMYDEYDIMMYDGEKIRGAEVVNFIKKYLGQYDETETAPIFVEVITSVAGKTEVNQYYNNEFLLEIRNFSNEKRYIKPTAMFDVEVIRNENQVILGVKFTQK